MQKAHPTTAVPFQTVRSGSRACRIQLFHPEIQQQPARLRIHVLFTNSTDTRVALSTAIDMATGLDSEIALIVTPIVPFPLPMENPPVPLEFASDQIRRLAETVHDGGIDLQGYIYLCRNPIETLI